MKPRLKASLTYCHDLPSPPGLALQVIDLAQDPNPELATVANVISLDMALSTRILRAANSPLFAHHRPPRNLHQAITLLGVNATVSLTLGFCIAHGLRQSFPRQQQHETLWRRSIIAALSARELGQTCGLRKSEELMLSGLLQDIGILALLHSHSEIYAPILEQAHDNAALVAAERRILGCDHAEVGAWLAREWRLPGYLISSIEQSEQSLCEKTPFTTCVALSGAVADIWLNEDPVTAKKSAMQLSQQFLSLDAERFADMLDRISTALPEIASLFEIDIQQPQQLDAVIAHAQELISLRNLLETQQIRAELRNADELEKRAHHLAEQASRDALTGVCNRYQLTPALEREFETATRRGWPISIVFIDLDDFKRINDTYGHLIGDDVLRNFAQTLQRLLRSSDTIARYGGEEFLLILPNTDQPTAIQVVQRVLEQIAVTPMAQSTDTPLHITFSAGLATHSRDCPFDDAQTLLKAADDVLYHSKHLGRNRVSVHNESTLTT
jgi:diguanylate cyclase (GGDEF)-like protein